VAIAAGSVSVWVLARPVPQVSAHLVHPKLCPVSSLASSCVSTHKHINPKEQLGDVVKRNKRVAHLLPFELLLSLGSHSIHNLCISRSSSSINKRDFLSKVGTHYYC
jgi:hypothetical protein